MDISILWQAASLRFLINDPKNKAIKATKRYMRGYHQYTAMLTKKILCNFENLHSNIQYAYVCGPHSERIDSGRLLESARAEVVGIQSSVAILNIFLSEPRL